MSIKKNKDGRTTFIFKPDRAVQRVYLAGDFNNWAPAARRMAKNRDGSYRARLALEPGSYQYKFIVDGEWLHDPDAPQQRNEHGTLNSVAEVVV